IAHDRTPAPTAHEAPDLANQRVAVVPPLRCAGRPVERAGWSPRLQRAPMRFGRALAARRLVPSLVLGEWRGGVETLARLLTFLRLAVCRSRCALQQVEGALPVRREGLEHDL